MISIYKKINMLVRKYRTRNPYELAEALGITIIKEDLGSIDGYYNKLF